MRFIAVKKIEKTFWFCDLILRNPGNPQNGRKHKEFVREFRDIDSRR